MRHLRRSAQLAMRFPSIATLYLSPTQPRTMRSAPGTGSRGQTATTFSTCKANKRFTYYVKYMNKFNVHRFLSLKFFFSYGLVQVILLYPLASVAPGPSLLSSRQDPNTFCQSNFGVMTTVKMEMGSGASCHARTLSRRINAVSENLHDIYLCHVTLLFRSRNSHQFIIKLPFLFYPVRTYFRKLQTVAN